MNERKVIPFNLEEDSEVSMLNWSLFCISINFINLRISCNIDLQCMIISKIILKSFQHSKKRKKGKKEGQINQSINFTK